MTGGKDLKCVIKKAGGGYTEVRQGDEISFTSPRIKQHGKGPFVIDEIRVPVSGEVLLCLKNGYGQDVVMHPDYFVKHEE